MPSPIFINYRRVKTRDKALFLRWILSSEFGEGVVFLDDQSISPGAKWGDELKNALEGCSVVLSLIHPDWHMDRDDRGSGDRLLLMEEDWVRLEISTALSFKDITVIPLLINDAYKDPQGVDIIRLKAPEKSWLPPDIQALFDRQAFRLEFNNLTPENLKEFLSHLEAVLPDENNRRQDLSIDQLHHGYYVGVLEEEFPLPVDLAEADPTSSSPYVGIRPFKREDARIFYGRSREIYELCFKLIHGEHRLLILDGYSGTGKSSLLQAGLIPRMEAQDWAVKYVRREEDKINGLPGLLKKVQAELSSFAGKKLLILDQVEEAVTNKILTLPKEIPDLIEDIVNALEDDESLTIILAFRAEYTAHIRHELEQHVEKPVFDDHNTLHPLERSGLIEAVRSVSEDKALNGPEKKYHIRFRPSSSLPETIADRLISSKAGYHIAPLLQVNMELLWERCRLTDGTVTITSHAIRDFIDTHESLLDHYVGKIRERITSSQVDDQALFKLLHFYIEEKPASAVRMDAEFNQNFGRDSFSRHIWNACRDLYLLYGEGSGDNAITRLTHDSMAHEIYKRYHELTVEKQATRAIYFFETLQKDIEDEIYTLQYDRALETLDKMMTLEEHRRETYSYLFELAFFWNEAGKKDKAHKVLQHWINSGLLVGDQLDQTMALLQNDPDQQTIRAWLLYIEPGRYDDMQARYLAPDKAVMVEVEGGEFMMGEEGAVNIEYEKPEHLVQIDSYKISNTAITWWRLGLYVFSTDQQEFLSAIIPSWGLEGDAPAINITWYESIEYCNWLSEHMGYSPRYSIDKTLKDPNNTREDDEVKWQVSVIPSSNGFGLPTEAQFEFAARGGNFSNGYEYSGSNIVSEVAWNHDDGVKKTQPVGKKAPNELGLFDLSGNVSEWCWDWYDHEYYKVCFEQGTVLNPQGPNHGYYRAHKGGFYNNSLVYLRVANRLGNKADERSEHIGFRMVRKITSFVSTSAVAQRIR